MVHILFSFMGILFSNLGKEIISCMLELTLSGGPASKLEGQRGCSEFSDVVMVDFEGDGQRQE